MEDFERRYLSGAELYGDDFTGSDLEEWFDSEREGYASLGEHEGPGDYGYHALNARHGFRHLSRQRYPRVLSFGGAFGDEVLPIIDRIDELTIVEPSLALRSDVVGGITPTYVAPDVSGHLELGDREFDLVTCFGVLHHIPNVSTVVRELARVTRPGGEFVVREPIISMGDWRYQRHPGITPRERGIPLAIFRSMMASSGFSIRVEALCDFPVTSRLGRVVGRAAHNSAALVLLDQWMSWLTRGAAHRYHGSSTLTKARPRCVMFVASREG